MLSKCTQDLYTACPSDLVLKTAGEQNCLIALFLGKIDVIRTKCKRLVLNESFEPIWIRSPDFNYWIYSLSTPQQVTVQCQEVGSPQTPKSSYLIKLEGTGVLSNSSSCYIHAETFKLLPHSLGKTTINLIRAHIVLPNIDNVLNFSEENLLQMNANYSVDWHHLDDIVERVTSKGYTRGIDVNKVVTALRGREVYHQPSHRTLFIVLIVIFAEFGTVWFFWFRITKQCKPCKRERLVQQPGAVRDENSELIDTGTRLQVPSNEDVGETVESTNEEDPRSQAVRTVFVRRGRLEADRT